MFNWDEFKNEKVAVLCDTEEKAREFVKECHKRDMKWEKCTENQTMFDWYKNDTCYNFETDENENRLMFCDKPYYERENYKIIKWESEKMKFNVGDKVRAIDNYYAYTNKKMGFVGLVKRIINSNSIEVETISSTDKNEIGECYGVWVRHFEVVEEPTEFTFQEVVSRNIPGVYVNCNDEDARVKSIVIHKDGDFGINAEFKGLREIGVGLGINKNLKFKLQEPKKRVTIHKVEHKQDGKKYDFISNETRLLQCYEFVICDTSQGKSYGRIVDLEERELTEEEYKQYKECWRA